MRIAIAGLGGVGGYIGAKLCALKDRDEIIFIARGEHLNVIQNKGLSLIEPDHTIVGKPSQAIEHVSEPVDILFVCTKTYHSQALLNSLQSAIHKDTKIIAIANGVNSQAMLQPLTPAKVSQACVYVVSHKAEAGVIKKATKPFLLVLDAQFKDALEERFEQAGIKAKFSDDIHKELWKKYLFIAAQASLTSYYQKGMGSIYQDHLDELKTILLEICSVAKAEGINLEEKEIDKALQTSSSLPLDAPTSLWLDLQKGGENELESLCHHLIKRSVTHGLKLPLMRKIYQALST